MAFLFKPDLFMVTLVFFANFYASKHILKAKPLHRQCSAQVVTEGETGVLTFLLRGDIDLSSDKVFVTVTRSKNPEVFILVCERNSPLKCKTPDPLYKTTGGISNHKVTLRIPNITKSFEDNYVLQVYVNDDPEPSETCRLTVQATNNRPCHAPKAKEGQTGEITFFLRNDLTSSSIIVTRNLKHGPHLVSCRRTEMSSDLKCDVEDKRFKVDGEVQERLKLRIPKIAQDFKGYYFLQDLSNNMDISLESCYLDVEGSRTDTNAENQDGTAPGIWILLGLIAIFLGVIALILAVGASGRISKFVRKRCRYKCTGGEIDESKQSLISTEEEEKSEDVSGKRWYREHITKEEEEKLSHFKKNTPGAFLIRISDTNPNNYTLTVLLDSGIKHLTLVHGESGFICHSTKKSFPTLSAVVDYYREHDIKVSNKVWGKLTKPLEDEPEQDWYFGQLVAKDAEQLLLAEINGPGSFLITESGNDDDGYDLSVNVEKEIFCFGIIPEDDGFRMLDTCRIFKTLSELVDNYRRDKLWVGKYDTYTKLIKPCEKTLEEVLFLEDLSLEYENKLLNSKKTRSGSFLILQESADKNINILAVYFDKGIQRFRITCERQGFHFVPTGAFFQTLNELLEYHKEHEIRSKDKKWGKLSTPFKQEPEADWYAGPLKRDDEEKMLLSRKNKPGAFLIRDGLTDPDNYVLAISPNGHTERHVIVRDCSGFRLISAHTYFQSLSKLVDHYRAHDIPPDGKSGQRRLLHPCARNPPDIWYSEELTRGEENLFMKSKRTRSGCFLITNEGDMPCVYTLAVYFEGHIKRFQVTHKKNGFVFVTTSMFFYTWYELVDYYRRHVIETDDRVWGKLTRPLRKEPTAKWYYTNIEMEHELDLFKGKDEGSFLIRDGMTESDEYVLAVCLNGRICHFPIMPEGDGFKLGDADTVFGTLDELVKRHTAKEIVFAGTSFGKLNTAVQRKKLHQRKYITDRPAEFPQPKAYY